MARIAPSILAADFVNLERDIHFMEQNGADLVHIDVMDGQFVPNITVGLPVVAAIRAVTELPLDVHLMIDRPARFVDAFCRAGADWLTVHVEADSPDKIRQALERIREHGVKAGISLKPGTPAEALRPYLTLCDLILVMTVEPGFGGQRFMEEMMPKLRQLRRMLDEVNPGCVLSVDGGVDSNTQEICKRSGAEILVAGSAYFRAADKPGFVKLVQG